MWLSALGIMVAPVKPEVCKEEGSLLSVLTAGDQGVEKDLVVRVSEEVG
jgi:hypothetical protein